MLGRCPTSRLSMGWASEARSRRRKRFPVRIHASNRRFRRQWPRPTPSRRQPSCPRSDPRFLRARSVIPIQRRLNESSRSLAWASSMRPDIAFPHALPKSSVGLRRDEKLQGRLRKARLRLRPRAPSAGLLGNRHRHRPRHPTAIPFPRIPGVITTEVR